MSDIDDALRLLGLAMSMATAGRMAAGAATGDGTDNVFYIEDCKHEAGELLVKAFGKDSPLIYRFVDRAVPHWTNVRGREYQLRLLESGELVRAVGELEKLLGMPEEYAETLLEGVVKPFADVRTM